ncbi:MAG: 3D domain-containing protein [Bacillota bacterium]|nr:3D domain-containing protein [Bacillota bacterium]
MLDNAESDDNTHSDKGRRIRSKRMSGTGYFFVILVLFILVGALCVNSYKLYKAYNETRDGFNEAVERVKLSADNQQGLSQQSAGLKQENNDLKVKYDQIINQNNEIIRQLNDLKSQNDELARKNKDLTEDNIQLQNSIKAAASVGIKPMNFTKFNGIASRGELDRGEYAGKFLGTAYTPSSEECGNNQGITNSGEPIIPGISIAIDNKYWPFGTIFYIRGLGYAVAMDTGSAIKGKKRFDFAVFDKKFAEALGSRYWDVYLVKMGNGKVNNSTFPL